MNLFEEKIDPANVTAFKEHLTEKELIDFAIEYNQAQKDMDSVVRKYNEIVAERLSRNELIKSIIEKYKELNLKYKTSGKERFILDQKFEIKLYFDEPLEKRLRSCETLFLSDLLLHILYVDKLLATYEHRNPNQA